MSRMIALALLLSIALGLLVACMRRLQAERGLR